MLKHLIDVNNLHSEFEKYGLDLEKDLQFIEELIEAPVESDGHDVSTNDFKILLSFSFTLSHYCP